MTRDDYRRAFAQAVGCGPTEQLLDRVEAAQAAGMTAEMILDAIAYEADIARTLCGVYSRAYGADRGRERASEVVYMRLRERWKEQNAHG